MRTTYLEAPVYHPPGFRFLEKSIFLGGSITGAHDWQKEAGRKLLPYFNVFNPRRLNYNSLDPSLEREQINWEFFYLNRAEILLFFFSFETLAPITMFEYGKYLGLTRYAPWREIYVCIHPEFKRKSDLIIQTELENPELAKRISFDLDECLEKIIKDNS
jgi:hypothetical protein